MTNHLVSYCMASFNHASYVGAMIDSVLQQDYDNLEVIVVDDGSLDESPRILESYTSKDPRVKIYLQENQGIVAARNRAIAHSNGYYISIIDSDDLLPPDRTRRLVDCLEDNQAAPFAYGDARLIDHDGSPQKLFSELHPPIESNDVASALLLNYCFVPAVSVMFRRDALNKSGPFWGAGESSDYLKWIELSMINSPVRLGGRPLGMWRRHGRNLSALRGHSRSIQYLNLIDDLNTILAANLHLSRSIDSTALNRRFANLYVRAAAFSLMSGDVFSASLHLKSAIRTRGSLSKVIRDLVVRFF